MLIEKNPTVQIADNQGRNVLNAVKWELIDVSTTEYNPGKSFFLLVGGAGNLQVVGTEMAHLPPASIPLIPLIAGYHPLRCSKVLVNALNSATNVYALFTEKIP